jgi:hypothetical protein
VVEGARLESEYAPKAYPGFESLPLRQSVFRLHVRRATNVKTAAEPRRFGYKPYCVDSNSEANQRWFGEFLYGQIPQYGLLGRVIH